MSMKLKPPNTGKDSAQDSATFERLPEKTKELLRLKEQLEKTTGPEEAVISRQIHHQAHRLPP